MIKIPKEKLSILSNITNVFNKSQSVFDSFKVDEYDHEAILSTIKLLISRVNHFSLDLMVRKLENNFDDVDFIRYPKYAVPASYNIRTEKVVINLQVLGKKEITNIPNRMLYAVIFYGYLCKLYTKYPLDIRKSGITVTDYFTDMMMKLFGRKYGIMASYQDMIPKLRFICITYILVSFYGIDQKSAYKKAVRSTVSLKDFNVDFDKYDLSDIREFIKLLSDSGVFPGLNINLFGQYVYNNKNLGIQALPMFEDEMRFMAVLGASTLPSAGLFPINLDTYNRSLHKKIEMLIHPYM